MIDVARPSYSDRFPKVFDRYTLLSQIADGGMAEILLAVEEFAQA